MVTLDDIPKKEAVYQTMTATAESLKEKAETTAQNAADKIGGVIEDAKAKVQEKSPGILDSMASNTTLLKIIAGVASVGIIITISK